MVGPRLRELVASSEGAGSLQGAFVRSGAAEHPVCGDRVEVDVRVCDGRIDALRWRAQGCPATQAVAVAAASSLPGQPVAGAAAALRARLAALGDLAAHEHHAEAMFLRALTAACGGAR